MRTESTLPFVFRNDQYRTQFRQEQFRRFDRQRRFSLEALEPRMLLDASTPLLAAQTAALKDGLAALEGWADTLDTISLFTQQIPVLNQSVDEAIDIGDVLRTKLAEAIDDLGSTPTPTDIVNKLQEAAYLGPGTVTINTANGSEVSFNVVFGFDGTTNTYLNIPGNDGGVSLDGAKESDATYNRLTLNTHLDLNLSLIHISEPTRLL